MIGRIEATLAPARRRRNTYMVFCSDNGYHMGEHRLMQGKLTAFDTDIRVPLIVVGPGVPAGRTVGKLDREHRPAPDVQRSSPGPTCPAGVDGRSLVGLLHGPARGSWRSAALIEHHGRDTDRRDPDFQARAERQPADATRRSARGDAVYVEYTNGEREYYDLARGPVRARQHLRGPQPGPAGAAPRHAGQARGLQRAGLLDGGGRLRPRSQKSAIAGPAARL